MESETRGRKATFTAPTGKKIRKNRLNHNLVTQCLFNSSLSPKRESNHIHFFPLLRAGRTLCACLLSQVGRGLRNAVDILSYLLRVRFNSSFKFEFQDEFESKVPVCVCVV